MPREGDRRLKSPSLLLYPSPLSSPPCRLEDAHQVGSDPHRPRRLLPRRQDGPEALRGRPRRHRHVRGRRRDDRPRPRPVAGRSPLRLAGLQIGPLADAPSLPPSLLQVHVMGALPLRSLSRLWGYLNSFEVRPRIGPPGGAARSLLARPVADMCLPAVPSSQLPVWAREPGFKLYSYAFGCNLDELEEPDLKKYASLGDFFYRTLQPGARPIADAPLVRPLLRVCKSCSERRLTRRPVLGRHLLAGLARRRQAASLWPDLGRQGRAGQGHELLARRAPRQERQPGYACG